jgi:hypothetical protein
MPNATPRILSPRQERDIPYSFPRCAAVGLPDGGAPGAAYVGPGTTILGCPPGSMASRATLAESSGAMMYVSCWFMSRCILSQPSLAFLGLRPEGISIPRETLIGDHSLAIGRVTDPAAGRCPPSGPGSAGCRCAGLRGCNPRSPRAGTRLRPPWRAEARPPSPPPARSPRR